MGGKSEIRPGKKGKTLKGPPKPQVETKVVSSGRWRQKPQETFDLKKKKKSQTQTNCGASGQWADSGTISHIGLWALPTSVTAVQPLAQSTTFP